MNNASPATPIPDMQLFRDAFNASPIGIAVENLDGQPLFVNPALCSMLGFSEEEMRSKHCVQFSPPQDSQKDWALFEQLRAGSINHYQLDKRYFRRDGSLVWGRLSLSVLNHRPSPLVLAMVEDITKQKKAEEALLRHTAIVESSEDAIASGTLDGIIVSWNGGAQQMYGYTEAEAVGKPISILIPPELPDEESKILETLKAGGRIEQLETVRVTKAGKRINVSLSIFPIKDSSGATVGVAGIARDITERKLAEEALRQSEEKFRSVFRDAGVGMVIVSPEGRFLAANGTFCDCLGYTEEELLAKTVESVTYPEDWPAFSQKLGQAITEGIGLWRFEKRCLHKSGRIVYTESSTSLIRNRKGEPQYFVGGVLDVSDRKEGEQRLSKMNLELQEHAGLLQSREELLKTFVKNVPVAVAMLDREMRYLQVSDRWCSDNLVEASEILGRSRYEAPEMPEHFKEANRRALQGETLRADEDSWESGGNTRWGRWEVRPWKNSDGTVGGILVFSEDITRRKQMEQELSDMTRKLISSQEQERTRIGRELHDDINQRLAMLAVELEQLKENPSELESRVQELRKSMAELSNDVQAMSHDLHSSKLEYLGVVAGMKSWCKEFGERQKMQIECRHDVRSTLSPELGLCLFRVLQEALHNAAKHSGVKRIEVQLREESGEIHLIVSDTGKGFDKEAALQGKGLGLTSMRERVRLVNGTIMIESKPMGGTTIHVRVPFASEKLSERAVG